MQPPRPFRGAEYDKDVFTFLPASNRDLDDSSRKRKLTAYDRQIPMSVSSRSHNFSRVSGPKSYDGDLRGREGQRSSPHRESSHFRDYPRKRQSWERDRYAESWYSDKRDRHETRSEQRSQHTGYSSLREHSQSRYHRDVSPNDYPPLSARQMHETSKWSSSAERSHELEKHEMYKQNAKRKNASHFQKYQDSGPQKRDHIEEVLATTSLEQSSKHIRKSQTDSQTRRPSRWSPLTVEPVDRDRDHVSNARLTRKENVFEFLDSCTSGPQRPQQTNIMVSSSYDQTFANHRDSHSLQQSCHKPQASAMTYDDKVFQTHDTSKWPPLLAEHCSWRESFESNRDQIASQFLEFRTCEPEKPAQMNAVASSSHEQASKNIDGSESLKQQIADPEAFVWGADAKCCNEETRKVESSSNANDSGEASSSSFTGFENTKMFGDSVGSSECELQNETKRLLQNALQLLSAASGIVSADSSGGKTLGLDDVKLMTLLLESGIQNLKHNLVETTISKAIEACPNLDKFGSNGENSSDKLDKQCKDESKASTFTDKLWAGTLQLSSSVSVSSVAFFKSGEKMQDFSWSESVEVKGKVRLEAFEKYVQDLPRSRSRGLMVMSFCCKEGSSETGLKDMKEVAEKYKERKKVGFAQLSNGVDLYICPHSDAVITILAKHGFFKGMAAVRDKTDPLIGCVVWRKNPSSVCASKTTETNTAQPSQPSLRSPSESFACQAQNESSSMASKNQKPVTSSSIVGGMSVEDKRPEFETDMDLDESNLQPPSIMATEHSAACSDEDDLPEYDFEAVGSKSLGKLTSDSGPVGSGFAAEKLKGCEVLRPVVSTQMRSECSSMSRTPPNLHPQGIISANLGHQSSSSLSLHIERQKQIREFTESSKISSINHFQQKQIENSAANPTSSTAFDNDDDDDDIPEWCPPGFSKPHPEIIAQSVGLLFALINPKASTSGFPNSASGPRPPIPPTPPPEQFQNRGHASAPHYPSLTRIRPRPEVGPAFSLSNSKLVTSGFVNLASGPVPPLPPTPPLLQVQFQNREYSPASHMPMSVANKPSGDGFMNELPDFGRNSTPRPWFQHQGIVKPARFPAWRGTRS